MRIIENRTGNRLARPLRILSILRGIWDRQRAPALQALADMGHEVVYVDQLLDLEGYRKLVQRLDFDVAVLWGNSLQNLLLSFDGNFFLDDAELPYVTLWTDNPIKHQALLKQVKSPFHKAQFVADTQVIDQLNELGWKNIFYLPPWHIDPEIYKPVAPPAELICDSSFAAAINPYDAERAKWRDGWDEQLNVAGDKIIDMARQSNDYIDVYEVLGNDWEVASDAFSALSHAMYFEQKAVSREQLIHAMGPRDLHIVGFGSAVTNRENVITQEGREWHDLSPLFCASKINLNLTPWPKSCHHRIFQIAASGAFPVTDWREDSVTLFEPEVEVVYFKSLDELPAIVDRYLDAPQDRQRIAAAARRRFLSEHTAAHRMAELTAKLYDLL